MTSHSKCYKCTAELGGSQTTSRAHSIGYTKLDGTLGRFFVTLCPDCFRELETTKGLDAFAEKELAARKPKPTALSA